jgi:anti-sigma-K factor RskA
MVAGMTLTLMLVSNLWLAGQLRAVQAQQMALAEQLAAGQLALGLLAQADTRTYAAASETASGRLIVSPSANTAVLLAKGLAALDAAHTYQLWLIPVQGQPVGIGLYHPSTGANVVVLPIQPSQDLADYAAFGITLEPAAGSPTPTGPLVWSVNF